jgi:uncharacterized protein (DUF362 family)
MPIKKTRVVEVHSGSINAGEKLNQAESAKMLSMGLDALSPTGVGRDLLDKLFPQKETIGLKINTLAGRLMSTSPELTYAFADILNQAGHSKKDIIIWDRREAELTRAGYTIRAAGSDYQCFATDTRGAGFAPELYTHKSIGSMVSRIQAELTQSVVNFPVLKDHSIAGLSGCLKNYYGVIHNPNKYHDSYCNPYLADLYEMDIIKGKQKLALVDASCVQFNGGPGYVSRWAFKFNSILLATDAVALDRVALEVVDRLRTKSGLQRLKDCGREPVYLNTATGYNAGCADLGQIDWVIVNI